MRCSGGVSTLKAYQKCKQECIFDISSVGIQKGVSRFQNLVSRFLPKNRFLVPSDAQKRDTHFGEKKSKIGKKLCFLFNIFFLSYVKKLKFYYQKKSRYVIVKNKEIYEIVKGYSLGRDTPL